MLDLAYTAVKGRGAFCNGREVHASGETSLSRSTAAFLCGYHCPKPHIQRVIGNIRPLVKRVLVNWSVASDFCSVAAGKIETVLNKNTELWDFLAAKLIAKEAGCVVTDLKGRPEKNDLNREFLTSNNLEIHRKVLPLL